MHKEIEQLVPFENAGNSYFVESSTEIPSDKEKKNAMIYTGRTKVNEKKLSSNEQKEE